MYTVIGLDKQTKNNPRTGKPMTIHYVNVQGPDGNITPVNVGFKQLYSVGMVLAGIEKNKFGDFVPTIVPGLGSVTGTAPVTSVVSSAAPPKSRGTFPTPKDSGEMSIIRQSALKAAIDTVSMLPQADLPNDPKGLVELVIEVAYEYVDFSSGHREAKEVAKLLKAS